MKKRILSIVLAICLVLAFVPITVFADSNSHTVTVNAGEGGKVSTDGTSWSNSVEVAVNDGETLDGKVQYKADEGYEFDGVIPKIVSVAGGGFHTVLLDSNGNVWTAGSNQFGQLGRRIIYNSNPIFTQVTVGNGVKIKAIAAGMYYTVLLDVNGNVWTAGKNDRGQLGRDTSPDSYDPTFTKVTDGISGVKIKAIAAGGTHTVLLDESNNVWTAGLNSSGQLGRETNSYKNSTFTQVTDGISDVKIKAIAAGSAHTVLIDESNNVWTAGNNDKGQLGRETSSDTDSTFTQATDGMGITAIAAGTSHTVLLDAYGNVWTAGLNSSGQLGRDTSPDSYDPTFTKVTDGIGGVKITAIASGQFHTVLLDENNNVWTAGLNDCGQLGRDTSPDSNDLTFTKVTDGISGVTIKAIAAGSVHTVLLDANGNVWTAGNNHYGQLGRDENTETDNANPTFKQVTDGIVITPIAAGSAHTVLLDSKGNVWTAGDNQFGQLGRETSSDSDSTFTQVKVGNDGVKIIAIAAGSNHTVLLDAYGNVWTAGLNSSGQLGRETSSDSDSTFTQVKVDNDGVKIIAIAAGSNHTVLLDAHGNVWTAGDNQFGQLGRETSSDSDSTFTQVNVGNGGVIIIAIAAGGNHTVLLATSRIVWTAGDNQFGQLGRETSPDSYDPTFTKVTDGIVGVLIDDIAAGSDHTVLHDSKGNVWTAGRNNSGQLGRDTSPDSYDPTFTKVTDGISGVKISTITAGGGHTVLLDESGDVWTAGLNDCGQLGRETGSDINSTFTQVTDGIVITAIAAGSDHTVLLDESKNVWTAGNNYFGQLGRDENTNTANANPTFTQIDVNLNTITFDEFVNIPIYNDSAFLVKFKDVQKPVITGLESNKTYCDDVEFTVSDNDGIASVTANDVELTATNGKYTLEKGKGTVTVVATDNSGNTAEVTVTVNNGHTWNNGVCSVCNYICVHKDDSPKDHECDICGKTISGHTGGTATCTSKASCEYCGEEYGELDSSNHTGSKVWKTTETQHKQYWDCCDAVVVDYENHTWNNGVCSDCGYPCSHDYDSVVTPPTCTESGYTTHTCANCGNSYVDSEVPATGHSFKFFKCVNCGMHYGCKGANCVFCSIVRWFDGLINSCEIWLTEAPVSIGKWFVGVFNCIVSAIK